MCGWGGKRACERRNIHNVSLFFLLSAPAECREKRITTITCTWRRTHVLSNIFSMMETVLYFRFTSQVNFISEIRIIIMLLYLISFSFHYLVQADAFIAAIQMHNHFDYDDVENNKQTKKKRLLNLLHLHGWRVYCLLRMRTFQPPNETISSMALSKRPFNSMWRSCAHVTKERAYA